MRERGVMRERKRSRSSGSIEEVWKRRREEKGERKEEERSFKDIDVKVKIGEAQKLGGSAERGTETILVKLEREKQRKEV